MANTVKMKRSAVPGKVPATTDLDLGEIAINTYDGKAYIKKNVSGTESIVPLGGAGSGDVTGPNSSTDNAIARFDGVSGKIIQNSGATIDDSGNLTATSNQASGTGANKMPVGTTAQRPSGEAGMYRLNSTTGEPEWYDATTSQWLKFREIPPYAVEYLVIGGGGGGGGVIAGGGGAGGYRANVPGENSGGGASAEPSFFVTPGASYSVVIGAGGLGGIGWTTNTNGTDGSPSTFGTITALGGGYGGTYEWAGNSGGSGGGGSGNGGAGTSGQGYAGGNGDGGKNYGGGGGGAGVAGGNFVSGVRAGNGGNGVASSITGSSVTRGGGGGGGTRTGWGSGGTGGTGGGGNGSNITGGTGNGGANTGGGGGGSGLTTTSTSRVGGSGGSGVVIIRYAGSQRATGGTVTSAGGYTIHTFTSSGTFAA